MLRHCSGPVAAEKPLVCSCVTCETCTRLCICIQIGPSSTHVRQRRNPSVYVITRTVYMAQSRNSTMDFVVHNFNLEITRTTTLLDVGRGLIHAATSSRGWINVGNVSENPPSSRSMSDFSFGMSYVICFFRELSIYWPDIRDIRKGAPSTSQRMGRTYWTGRRDL